MALSKFQERFRDQVLPRLLDTFSVPATYAHGGSTIDITVMPGEIAGLVEPIEGGHRAAWEGEVRLVTSEVATPALGAFVTIDAETYAIVDILELGNVTHTVRLERETGRRHSVAHS